MAKPRGLFHFHCIVSADGLYGLSMSATQARALDVKIEPVISEEQRSAGNGADPDAAPISENVRVPTWQILQPWWAKQKQFNIRDALAFAFENGIKSKGAVYTAVLTAQKDKWLVRTGPGLYKTLPALKAAMKKGPAKPNNYRTHAQEPAARAKPQLHEVTHSDYILKLIKGGTTVYMDIKKAFAADGRVPRSVDGAIGKLKEQKKVTAVSQGVYKLLAKGEEQLKA